MAMDAGEQQPDNDSGTPGPFDIDHPERVIAAGLILGIISLYLPWLGFTAGGGPFDLFGGAGFPGFANWGIGYFIAWLVASLLLSLRTVCRDAADDLELPVADWYIFGACGTLMGLFALTTLELFFPGGWAQLSHLRYGWWLGMLAAILVVAGALSMRRRTVHRG